MSSSTSPSSPHSGPSTVIAASLGAVAGFVVCAGIMALVVLARRALGSSASARPRDWPTSSSNNGARAPLDSGASVSTVNPFAATVAAAAAHAGHTSGRAAYTSTGERTGAVYADGAVVVTSSALFKPVQAPAVAEAAAAPAPAPALPPAPIAKPVPRGRTLSTNRAAAEEHAHARAAARKERREAREAAAGAAGGVAMGGKRVRVRRVKHVGGGVVPTPSPATSAETVSLEVDASVSPPMLPAFNEDGTLDI